MAAKYTDLHDYAAEEGLLACILIKNDLLADLKVTAADFARPSNSLIFIYMKNLFKSGTVIDIITLTNALKDDQKLEDAGGIAGVTSLINREPTAASAGKYQDIILGYSQRRQIHHACVEIASEAIDGNKTAAEIVDDGIGKLNDIGKSEESADTTFVSGEKMMIVAVDSIFTGQNIGLRTGFRDLDSKLAYGMRPGDLLVLAGRPSMGKTALCLNIVTHLIGNGKRVLFFSLETDVGSVGTRLVQSCGCVTQAEIINVDRDEDAAKKIMNAAEWFAKHKEYLMINTAGQHTPATLRTICRRAKVQKGLDFVVIDHAQLLNAEGFKNDRVREMSYISRSLKQLAKELKIPILLLSQLNRSVESRDNKRPRLSDLRESGSIEQDADVVMLIYRDAYYSKDDSDHLVELNIAKQKDGATGVVPLWYAQEFMKFVNAPIRETLGQEVKEKEIAK